MKTQRPRLLFVVLLVLSSILKAQNDSIPKISYKTHGYINLDELVYSPSYENINNEEPYFNEYSYGFRTVNGYQFNEYFSLGLGIGVDKYVKSILFPVTIDARTILLKGKESPYFSLNVGYSIGFNQAGNNIGGLLLNPSIGIKMFISKRVAYYFGVGYKLRSQTNTSIDLLNYSNTYSTIYSKFLSISTGFSF